MIIIITIHSRTKMNLVNDIQTANKRQEKRKMIANRHDSNGSINESANITVVHHIFTPRVASHAIIINLRDLYLCCWRLHLVTGGGSARAWGDGNGGSGKESEKPDWYYSCYHHHHSSGMINLIYVIWRLNLYLVL